MPRSNGNRPVNGRPNGKQVPAVLKAAFVHALKSEQYSEARAARSMGVSRATVERYVSGATEVNAKYPLRSKRLWRPFWLCVGRLMNRKAA
jgi:transposase